MIARINPPTQWHTHALLKGPVRPTITSHQPPYHYESARARSATMMTLDSPPPRAEVSRCISHGDPREVCHTTLHSFFTGVRREKSRHHRAVACYRVIQLTTIRARAVKFSYKRACVVYRGCPNYEGDNGLIIRRVQ